MLCVKPVLNLAAYKFVTLADPLGFSESIRSQAQLRGLKGTVLLAEEGINLVLAGDPVALRGLLAWLRSDARFDDLAAKESWSQTVPFGRLRVKVKREIIRMNHPAIRPEAGRAPTVTAATLERWLAQGHDDGGREVVTLDTRNGFEVDAGSFEGALDWRLSRFSDFPAALATHRDALAGKTVVTYCTGGIRCEKAALLMREVGIEHVRQLDGGILKYFEETAGAPHWRGGCFVFDERTTLDAALQPQPA